MLSKIIKASLSQTILTLLRFAVLGCVLGRWTMVVLSKHSAQKSPSSQSLCWPVAAFSLQLEAPALETEPFVYSFCAGTFPVMHMSSSVDRRGEWMMQNDNAEIWDVFESPWSCERWLSVVAFSQNFLTRASCLPRETLSVFCVNDWALWGVQRPSPFALILEDPGGLSQLWIPFRITETLRQLYYSPIPLCPALLPLAPRRALSPESTSCR